MTNEEFNKLSEKEQKDFYDSVVKNVEDELSSMSSQDISDTLETLAQKFDEMTNDVAYSIKYDMYWMARAKDDPQGEWSEKDQIKFPRFGWAGGRWIEPIGIVGEALNKIKGVSASDGTIYKGRCYHGGRIMWTVNFDDIASFQRFLWAGCYRYFPMTKNEDWLLTVNDGDPDYSKTDKIRMQLQYQDLNADRNKWEKDCLEFAKGLEKYAAEEEEIAKRLS
jgi:hypothetical protein